MSLAQLGLTDRGGSPWQSSGRFNRAGVEDSEDLRRIVALPRRAPPTLLEQTQMAAVMTALLTRGPVASCRCAELRPGFEKPCLTALFPVQGWYLWEAMTTIGAVGMLAAGAGKTALDVLLPMVVPKVRRAALLIPPNLRDQFALDYECWSQHFRTPNLAGGARQTAGAPKLDVLSYSELSNESCATWLSIHKPDIVICDEAHALKDVDSVRTDRFLRYYIANEDSRLFWHSGSAMPRSPHDCAHLAALALREGSPFPLLSETVGEWSEALGAKATLAAGALRALCAPGETARQGFRRRLVETAGVITTEDAQIETPLRIRVRPIVVSKVLKQALTRAREGERPDTEELVEKVEQVACARQLALGFFYRWCYPRGEPEALINTWFARRKAFNRELRLRMEKRTDLMDSPALLRDAAQRWACGYHGDLPTWACPAWPDWRDIEKSVYHEKETQWLDESIALDAVAWGRESPGIIWYAHDEFGKHVAALGGFPLFEGDGEQPGASAAIAREDGTRTIVASAKAHGTGKNLQMFSRALITSPSASGGEWEQLLARLHRYGQRAAAVTFDVYMHTPEMHSAWDSAIEDATQSNENTGKAERLLFAELTGME